MSLLLDALKKANKAKGGAASSLQIEMPVLPAAGVSRDEKPAAQLAKDTLALDFGELSPPPTIEAETQSRASEMAFPEIMLDELPPPEPPSAPREVVQPATPSPDARELTLTTPNLATLEMLITPNPATLDLPETELAGVRDNSPTQSKPEAGAEPALSLDFQEPAQQLAALEIEPTRTLTKADVAEMGDLPPSSQNSEPPRMDNVPDTFGQQSAARPIAPPPIAEYSAPPPPTPSPKAATEADQAGMGGLPPNSHKTTNQETAKKFLAAKQGKPKRNLKLLGGILIGSMVAGAAGAYYYWQALSQPTINFLPPRQQAAMPLASPPQPPSPQPPSPQPPVVQPIEPQPVATPQPPPPSVISEEQDVPKESVGKPANLVKHKEDLPAGTPLSGHSSTGAGKGTEKKTATPADEMEEAPVGASAGSPDSGIKIRRDTVDAQLDPLLTSAYWYFMAGETGKAETDYRKALRRTPNSRDALLGLAAIAASRNQTHEATSNYLRVLQLDPGDVAAQAGLIGLRGFSDTTLSESRLKILLAQNPNEGYLHFALGNQYAQQLRWPEAQEAYFNALHADSGNADYAFNLAVSLEHLDQRKPALAYYRRAMDLMRKRSAGFDSELLENRIYELQRHD